MKVSHQQIIETIKCIPAGRVASYGQIADLAGLPGRARLVGKVLREAPADLHLPWHRVLRSNGQLAFAAGTEPAIIQADKLTQEGVVIKSNRVDLKHFAWSPSLDEILFQLKH